MSALSNSPNHFLASLSVSDRDLVEPHLRPLEVPSGAVLHKAADTIDRIYFPYTGAISLVVGVADGHLVEAGMFGRNSVIGGAAALDGSVALNQAVGQVAGSGVTAQVSAVKRLVSQSETLRVSFARHEQMTYAQTQQVAACNALHDLEERLSRWLLQVRDLMRSDTLLLTQEFLGQMLGVRRNSVTLVARQLQDARLINYRRGHIHVLDVEGLQDTCCECYQAINDHFHRIAGWVPDFNDLPARNRDH